MLIITYIIIIIIAFLSVLNSFLRGMRKTQIDILLKVLMLVFIFLAFYVGGLMAGLLAIVLTIFLPFIFRPIAARTAAELLSLPSNGPSYYPGLPSKKLELISLELSRPTQHVEEIFNDSRDKAIEALFNFCKKDGKIREIIYEYNISYQDFCNLYWELMGAGAGQWAGGHWVAASALAYPESFRYILERKTISGAKRSEMETAFKLIMYFERGIPLRSKATKILR
jgi:hypothetical protein